MDLSEHACFTIVPFQGNFPQFAAYFSTDIFQKFFLVHFCCNSSSLHYCLGWLAGFCLLACTGATSFSFLCSNA